MVPSICLILPENNKDLILVSILIQNKKFMQFKTNNSNMSLSKITKKYNTKAAKV